MERFLTDTSPSVKINCCEDWYFWFLDFYLSFSLTGGVWYFTSILFLWDWSLPSEVITKYP